MMWTLVLIEPDDTFSLYHTDCPGGWAERMDGRRYTYFKVDTVTRTIWGRLQP